MDNNDMASILTAAYEVLENGYGIGNRPTKAQLEARELKRRKAIEKRNRKKKHQKHQKRRG